MRGRGELFLGVLALALGPCTAAADGPAHGFPLPSPDDGIRGDSLVRLRLGWGLSRSRRVSSELTEAGRSAQGLFVSALAVRHRGIDRVIATLRRARMTALVTDLKDDRGEIVYEATHPSLVAQRNVVLRDLRSTVRALHEAGIYAIARIVCFKDGALALARPDLAARDDRNGRVWRGRLGFRWTSPYSAEVQDRIIAVARDAEALGFDEVQLDYIRFPVEEEAEHAVFPHAQETLRHYVIARFLERLDAAIGIPISVDLYGLTAFHRGDPAGLGQSVEDFVRHVEVLSPMLYSASFDGIAMPTLAHGHRAAAIVSSAVGGLVRRVGADVAIRPYLQAFPFREPEFGVSYIHAQAQAARAAGADGLLFWNPRSDYRIVVETIRALGPVSHACPAGSALLEILSPPSRLPAGSGSPTITPHANGRTARASLRMCRD